MENQNTQWKQADKGYQYIQGVGTCMAIYAQDGTGIVAFVFQKDGQDNAPIIANAPETRNELDALERRFAFLQDERDEALTTSIAANHKSLELLEQLDKWKHERDEVIIDKMALMMERDRLKIERDVFQNERENLQECRGDETELDALAMENARLIVAVAGIGTERDRLKQENAELVEALGIIANHEQHDFAPLSDNDKGGRLKKIESIAREVLARHATPEATSKDYVMPFDILRTGGHFPLPDPFAGLPGYEPKRPIFDGEEEGAEALRQRRTNTTETRDEHDSNDIGDMLRALTATTVARHTALSDPIAEIYGTEVSFSLKVPRSQILNQCREIWENPEGFSSHKNGSDAAYYDFLKFLWVKDGESDIRLTDIVLPT